MVRAHLIISGIVQGVFFRYRTCQRAHELGVSGWVKNRMDGDVEAVLEGESGKVEEIVKWCHQGPPGAVVTEVKVFWEDYRNEFSQFSTKL
jgi:acylphosphatase